jgi:hypothetical protein
MDLKFTHIFSLSLGVAEALHFCDFLLHKNFKRYPGPMQPPGDRNWKSQGFKYSTYHQKHILGNQRALTEGERSELLNFMLR